MIIATAAVKVTSATQYCAISQVQPQIFSEITFLTLPATWQHFPSIIQLHQVSGMPLTNSQMSASINPIEILNGNVIC